MDTSNSEYQKALNELFIAVVKVLKLSGSSCVTDAVRQQETIAKLASVLSSLNVGVVNLPNSRPVDAPDVLPVDVPTPSLEPAPVARTPVSTRYATAPEEDEGKYYFRRTVELTEEEDERYFAISVYDDDTCTFVMKGDVRGQKLQTLVDNKEYMLDCHVVECSGTPSANCGIENVEPGEAKKHGKSILITKPLKIRFK